GILRSGGWARSAPRAGPAPLLRPVVHLPLLHRGVVALERGAEDVRPVVPRHEVQVTADHRMRHRLQRGRPLTVYVLYGCGVIRSCRLMFFTNFPRISIIA